MANANGMSPPCARVMATRELAAQRNEAIRNIIFSMFLLCADDNWTDAELSVGVDP